MIVMMIVFGDDCDDNDWDNCGDDGKDCNNDVVDDGDDVDDGVDDVDDVDVDDWSSVQFFLPRPNFRIW